MTIKSPGWRSIQKSWRWSEENISKILWITLLHNFLTFRAVCKTQTYFGVTLKFFIIYARMYNPWTILSSANIVYPWQLSGTKLLGKYTNSLMKRAFSDNQVQFVLRICHGVVVHDDIDWFIGTRDYWHYKIANNIPTWPG